MSTNVSPSPDTLFMQRALSIAQAGMAHVAPNPMVGAVITRGDTILAEGYHARYGGPHAERIAIDQARREGVDLRDTTLYVTLEPCAHQGKTPPCCQAILEAGIGRVVIATADPNPLVAGKGIEALRQAGVSVEVGLLEAEAKHLNRRFLTYHTRKRPYIILKWAQTLDGFVDSRRQPDEAPRWITNEECRHLVHKWRAQEMAILVGTNTAVRDNPRLNVRHWHGRNPLRVVLDRTLRIPPSSNLFNGESPTLVFAGNNHGAATRAAQLHDIPGLELLLVDFMKGIELTLLRELHARGVTSLIVEGGTQLLCNFIKRELWDEARIFVGNEFFREGVAAPQLPCGERQMSLIGDCQLHRITNPSPRAL